MSVPPELVGAWRRVGLTLDDTRLVDCSDVLWLQTPTWFADIRLRLLPEGRIPTEGVPAWLYAQAAFAGTAHWSSPMMTWEHVLDYNRSVAPGSNNLARSDGVLVERGITTVAGSETPFTEEWLRMSGADDACSLHVEQGACRVEVGGWAIELRDARPEGQFSAVRYRVNGGGWKVTGSLPL